AAPRLQLVVVGEWDGRASGERVSVARPHARPEDVGVGGEAGVDVEVAEVGGTEETEARAGLTRLRPLPGGRRGVPTRHSERCECRNDGSAHPRTLAHGSSTCRGPPAAHRDGPALDRPSGCRQWWHGGLAACPAGGCPHSG